MQKSEDAGTEKEFLEYEEQIKQLFITKGWCQKKLLATSSVLRTKNHQVFTASTHLVDEQETYVKVYMEPDQI